MRMDVGGGDGVGAGDGGVGGVGEGDASGIMHAAHAVR